MYAIRIRGIYATALTKLFLDHRFRIAQPSRPIRERFKLKNNKDPYDVDLYDLPDRQGVFLAGVPEAVEQARAALSEELLDLVTQSFPQGIYSVYHGIVRSSGDRGTLVQLSPEHGLGLLPDEQLHPGEVVTVQICGQPDRGREPLLRRMIGIPGRYAVLISTCRIAVSKEIQDHDERMRLIWLGAELCPQGWGLVWHTAAQGRSRATLAADVAELSARAARMKRNLTELPPPALVLEGDAALQCEFPGGAKAKLDRIRATVLHTVAGHHRYKAHTETSEDIDEDLLVLQFPAVGSELRIEHVKPDGKVLLLGRGRVVESDPERKMLILEREIRGGGHYDGLGVAKEQGDRARTEFWDLAWGYRTRYYSRDGALKGEYFNINTPLEIYPDRVRYIDLEIDIVRRPGEEPRLIDDDLLEKAVAAGHFSPRLAEHAREVAQRVLEGAEPGELRLP